MKLTKRAKNNLENLFNSYYNGEIGKEELISSYENYSIYKLPRKVKKQYEKAIKTNISSEVDDNSVLSQLQNRDRCFKMPKKNIALIKEKFIKTKHKKLKLAVGLTITVVSALSLDLDLDISKFINNSHFVAANSTEDEKSNKDNSNNNKNSDKNTSQNKQNKSNNVDENLAFDPLDKELEIEMLKQLISDFLQKGIEFNDEELENQIDGLIDFRTLANFNEFSFNDLAMKYQNANKSWIDAYNNYTAFASTLTYDALTASKEKGELPDLSPMFSDKTALALVQKAQNLMGELVDATAAKNEVLMEAIAIKCNEFIMNELMANDSDSYNPVAYDLAIRYVREMKDVLINYPRIQNILMDKTTEDALAVNGLCYDGEQLSKILSGELPGATNKYSKNIIYFVEKLKIKFDEAHRFVVDDQGNLKVFEKVLSQAYEISQIAEWIRQNNILASFVSNISYEELYHNVDDLTKTGATTKKRTVKSKKGVSVPVDEMAAHGVNYDIEKAKGKSDDEIIQQYEQNIRNETEQKMEKESVITDMNGNKEASNANTYDYRRYYELGSKAGCEDARGKTAEINSINVPSNVPAEYHSVWSNSYITSYNETVRANLKAINESNTTYQPVENQVVSKEEDTQVSPTIKDENISKPPQIVEEQTTQKVPIPTQSPTPAPDGFVPIEDGDVIEEEMGEEILTSSTSVRFYESQINLLKYIKNEIINTDNPNYKFYPDNDKVEPSSKTYIKV